MNAKNFIKVLTVATLVFPAIGCEKMLTVQSENQITDITELIQTPEDAQNVLNGAYDVLANTLNGRIQNVNELLSSNLIEPNMHFDLAAVYTRSTNTVNTTLNNIYQDLYLTIFRCNLLLDYAKNVNGISNEELNRIESEAKFLRAMAHFWVLKTWAQPWGYTSDNNHLGIVIRDRAVQTPLPRSTVKQCYEFIQQDLQEALDKLPPSNGYYANKYAAAALLAYTYFLQNDFSNCVQYANLVINSGEYQLEPTLDSFHAWTLEAQNTPNPEMIFGSNSIFQSDYQDSRVGSFTGLYRSYSITGATLSLSTEAYNAIAQTPADLRNQWLHQANNQNQLTRFGTAATNTLNINYFDLPFLRLTHLKLIRAESLGEMGMNLSTAIADLNDIRNRAFLPGTNEVSPTASASDIIQFAREEFRKETLAEGLYIDQLKRRGARGEAITIRNAPWNCDGMAIQFPLSENTGVDFVFNPSGGCN